MLRWLRLLGRGLSCLPEALRSACGRGPKAGVTGVGLLGQGADFSWGRSFCVEQIFFEVFFFKHSFSQKCSNMNMKPYIYTFSQPFLAELRCILYVLFGLQKQCTFF